MYSNKPGEAAPQAHKQLPYIANASSSRAAITPLGVAHHIE
jgi:hypothetical protein